MKSGRRRIFEILCFAQNDKGMLFKQSQNSRLIVTSLV